MAMAGTFSGLRCPKCGADLLVQGKVIWCSLVPGDTTPGCDWGIAKRETLADYVKEKVKDLEQQLEMERVEAALG